ncbi:hypothetical protein [Xylella taiwanensis]|uniref:hypothetical protein n=1 Tax=Xylella taiwanensis TaxID=1444770 RepID=UPI001F29CF6F|nr:hypothetical protein [Xylella taiwanensis]
MTTEFNGPDFTLLPDHARQETHAPPVRELAGRLETNAKVAPLLRAILPCASMSGIVLIRAISGTTTTILYMDCQ